MQQAAVATSTARSLPLLVRASEPHDVAAMAQLIGHWATRGRLLALRPAELERQLERFVVAVRGPRLVACGGLDWPADGVAELRSLAVLPSERRSGAGQAVARRLLEIARERGAERVAVLTFETAFFERLGFQRLDERAGASLHPKPNTLGNTRMALAL
jgi:amino-acid N-acetyltransferase